jgi:radical SAM protein with 4Fe4S-binding SPASM domain
MCSRDKKIEKGIVPSLKHMSLPDFERILSTIRPGRMQISGQGEPFLNPDLQNMIALAKSRRVKTSVISNFTVATETAITQIADAGLDLLKVSLDAATPQTYMNIRGVDKFDIILERIRYLTASRKKKPFVRLQFCILADNYTEIADFVDLAHTLSVDAVYFQALELTDFEEHSNALVGSLNASKLRQHIDIGLQKARALGLATNLRDIIDDYDTYWRKYEWSSLGKTGSVSHDSRVCLAPWTITYITVDGNIKPCCCFSREQTVFGNLLEVPFQQVWNGEAYKRFRSQMRRTDLRYDVCRDCISKNAANVKRLRTILPGILR